MSYQAVEAVMQRSRAVGSERLLLMVIATHADAETLTAYLGETTLCKEANMKERNLRYTLAKLKASGELECVVGGGRGRANLYRLTLPAQSDKGAEDCPLPNNQMEQEKGQEVAPLSDHRGQSVAGFTLVKGGNPSSEKGQPMVEKGQSIVKKGQPIAPQPLEPEEPERTDAAAPARDPFQHAAVKLYIEIIRPDPGLPIRHAELIAAEVVRLDIWRNVLLLFAGNDHRGRDGSGRQVGYALDRYRKEVDKANAETPAAAKPPPPKAFSCPNCKNTGEVVRMNPQTREDERIPCSCQTRLTTSTGALRRPAMTR